MLIIKTDANGAVQWSQSYAETSYNIGFAVLETSSGGYSLVGYSESSSGQFNNIYLVTALSNGKMDWSRIYGGPKEDYAYSMTQTRDGGFVMAGMTYSAITGYSDIYLVKAYSDGQIQWSKTYDITNYDYSRSVIQTSDGGYALAGYADSDMVLIKTDENGTMQWYKTYDINTEGYDYAYSVVQTADGGYALGGYTSGESSDVCIVKTSPTARYSGTKPTVTQKIQKSVTLWF
jgi:hypothetical protein